MQFYLAPTLLGSCCRAISAHRIHLAAIRLHTSLFTGSLENSAMYSHSAACNRNTSEGTIGRSPCKMSRDENPNESERFRQEPRQVCVVTLMGQQGGAPCPTKSEERKPALRFCLSPRCEDCATSPAPQAPAVASRSICCNPPAPSRCGCSPGAVGRAARHLSRCCERSSHLERSVAWMVD
jgi:hypothetical protein